MRWPRKGILIRLAIYVPLISFLGWDCYRRTRARSEAEAEADAANEAKQELERHKRVYTMPDGTKQEVYELTPEQAERLLGKPVDLPDESGPQSGKENAPESGPAR